jgi:hypothetical protein
VGAYERARGEAYERAAPTRAPGEAYERAAGRTRGRKQRGGDR